MSKYVEFNINANYFQTILTAELPVLNNQDRVFNETIIRNASQFLPGDPLPFVKKIILTVASKKFEFDKDKSISIDDFLMNVTKALNAHRLNYDKASVAAIYGLATYKYALHQWWFRQLNQPIQAHSKSFIELELKAKDNFIEISYDQREKRIGNFIDASVLSVHTELKVKQQMTINKNSYTLSNENEVQFSISERLWDSHLIAAAQDYLKHCDPLLTESNCLVMIPFLTVPAIKEVFATQYANQPIERQRFIRRHVEYCYEKKISERQDLINVLCATRPTAQVVMPTVTPQTKVISSNPTTGITITEKGPVQIAPTNSPPRTPEEEFKLTYIEFIRYVEFEGYEASQSNNLKRLATALANLSDNQRQTHMTLLTDMMKSTIHAVKHPDNVDNLTHCLTLIEPLKRKIHCQLAITFLAVVTGAMILAASLAVAIASFGVTTPLSGMGIAVGTSLLTKALSITAGVVGLSMLVSTTGMFARQKFRPVVEQVENIHDTALKFLSHRSAQA